MRERAGGGRRSGPLRQAGCGRYSVLARFYDAWMGEAFDYAAWAGWIEALIRAHAPHLPEKRLSIIDMACGTGTMAHLLAGAGHAVVGFDRSPEMLALARSRAPLAGGRRRSGTAEAPGAQGSPAGPLGLPDLTFRRRDLRRGPVGLGRRFDIALCLCDSLNYLPAGRCLARVFARTARMVSRSGLLIFDVNTAFQLAHGYGDRRFRGSRPGCRYLWQNEYDPRRRSVSMRLRLTLDAAPARRRAGVPRPLRPRIYTEVHREQAYSIRRLRRLVRRAGWRVLGLYAGMGDEAPAYDSDRVTFVLGRRTWFSRRPEGAPLPRPMPGTRD